MTPAPRWARRFAAWAALTAALAAAAPAGAAQEALDREVEAARLAWLAHDIAGLVARSDTVRLHLPGIAVSPSLRPGQAARLLERYVGPAEERRLALAEVRRLAPDHAYAELRRHYVVRGTTEEREETVYLGFRLLGEGWRLREVRVTP